MNHFNLIRRGGLCLCSVLFLGLCACDLGLAPEDIVARFNTALKNGDVDTAIECYDPLTQKQLEAGAAIGDALLGGAFTPVAEAYIGYSMLSEYADYDFVITESVLTDDTHAVVTEDVYEAGTYSYSSTLALVKAKGVWRISDSTFF